MNAVVIAMEKYDHAWTCKMLVDWVCRFGFGAAAAGAPAGTDYNSKFEEKQRRRGKEG